MRKLVDRRWHLESRRENLSLPLKTNISGITNKTRDISLWLYISTNTKVPGRIGQLDFCTGDRTYLGLLSKRGFFSFFFSFFSFLTRASGGGATFEVFLGAYTITLYFCFFTDPLLTHHESTTSFSPKEKCHREMVGAR